MTNNTAKLIRLLHQKKHRVQENLFLVEGAKSVLELLSSDFQIEILLFTEKFENQYFDKIKNSINHIPEVEIVTAVQLEKVSTFKSNDMALAVVHIPENDEFNVKNELVLALANIRDPGNLGTIIRIADWYGISKIICSVTSVDWYNPKTISASMGSFSRVKPFYTDLKNYFEKTSIELYGAFMDGKNIHELEVISSGIIVIGNESNGIPKELENSIQNRITIPKFGHAESLNAGTAMAIICDNFKRKMTSSNVI